MKVTVLAPESITVGHYIDWYSDLSPIKRAAIASGMEAGEIRALPRSVVDEIMRIFEDHLESIPNTFKPTIELDGVKFGLHPNIDRMTWGEFLDLQSCEKDWIPNIHNALAVLYRPVTVWHKDRYQIEEYKAEHMDNSTLMRDLPVSVAGGAFAFFLTLRNDLTNNLAREQLTIPLKKVVSQLKEDLRVSGDGYT